MRHPLGDGRFYERSALPVECRLYPGHRFSLPVVTFFDADGSEKSYLENFPFDQGCSCPECNACLKSAHERLSRPASP